MMRPVLVTGVDQHQGLAVVQGLGRAGVPVIATSPSPRAMGYASRYATATATYTPPQQQLDQFIEQILALVEHHRAELIIPVSESTLVALDRRRGRIEKACPIAAPDSATLALAIDKLRTFDLATRAGVPVPKTIHADTLDDALECTRDFRFPVAFKPRGNQLHADTSNRFDYKVKYAADRSELAQVLTPCRSTEAVPLIQEYVPGGGVNVTALFEHGRPVVMVPYKKLREVPLTGGVSVMRKTLPLDPRLADHVTRLLGNCGWHGVAMVEFKYDPEADRYVLMEINGRFCASTALLIDAGVNLPRLAHALYTGRPVPKPDYRVNVSARWLRGDFRALVTHLNGTTPSEALPSVRQQLPSKSRAIFDFLADFRPAVRYDEFKWDDPWPGLVEAINWGERPLRRARALLSRLAGTVPQPR